MSYFVFLLTLLEVVITFTSYAISKSVFTMVAIYGSPFYLLMNVFGSDSVIHTGNPLYLGMFIFHIMKYFALFYAQVAGDRGKLFWTAVIFESSYLAMCAYHIN